MGREGDRQTDDRPLVFNAQSTMIDPTDIRDGGGGGGRLKTQTDRHTQSGRTIVCKDRD